VDKKPNILKLLHLIFEENLWNENKMDQL